MASKFYSWHHNSAIHYHRRGMGDPLLLIHNIYPGASYEEFERNIDELSRHFTVFAIDLIGFGQSSAPRIKYRAKDYVELIFDFLREEIGGPAHVMAAGLSCSYVTEVAAWRANLFKKLVFICPRSEPTGMDAPRWLAPMRRFLLATPPMGGGFYQTMAGEGEIALFLATCFHNPKNITAARVRRLVGNAALPGSIGPYASLITGYLDHDLLASLPRVNAPVLLVWGRQAKPTPVEHSVRLAAVAQRCRLEVIESAGSWVHAEQSARVNAIVVDYLEDRLASEAAEESIRRAMIGGVRK